jgi:copper chaperone CopZ
MTGEPAMDLKKAESEVKEVKNEVPSVAPESSDKRIFKIGKKRNARSVTMTGEPTVDLKNSEPEVNEVIKNADLAPVAADKRVFKFGKKRNARSATTVGEPTIDLKKSEGPAVEEKKNVEMPSETKVEEIKNAVSEVPAVAPVTSSVNRVFTFGRKLNARSVTFTMTREQAMNLKKPYAESEESKNAEVPIAPELSPARRLQSPHPAKRLSLPDFRNIGSKGNAENSFDVEVPAKRNSAPGISFQTSSLNLSDKYSIGEVIMVTLSDGRRMSGEIFSLKNDILIMEYAEGKQLFRALIEVRTDKSTGKPTDDLISWMEIPSNN